MFFDNFVFKLKPHTCHQHAKVNGANKAKKQANLLINSQAGYESWTLPLIKVQERFHNLSKIQQSFVKPEAFPRRVLNHMLSYLALTL